jgi:hypothetical protein
MAATAMLKIQTTKHPISEDVIGYRLVAAIQNMAGHMRGRPIPSFRKPYFICEGSDLPAITQQDIDKFVKDVRWQGYTQFVALGELGDMMAT